MLGTGRIEALPAVLRRREEEDDRPCETGFDPDEVVYTPGAIARPMPHRAAITVIEGCNKNCTFCVVPRDARTRTEPPAPRTSWTNPARLLGEGALEIELLGQTVNAFRDPETGRGSGGSPARGRRAAGTPAAALRDVPPRNFPARLIAAMADTPAVVPALHLPVQSGSDAVLRRMKRQYTRAEYLDLVASLRRRIPDLALSTDVIVGFPGETARRLRRHARVCSRRSGSPGSSPSRTRPARAPPRSDGSTTSRHVEASAPPRAPHVDSAGYPARAEPRARRADASTCSSTVSTGRGSSAPAAPAVTAS